MVVHAPTARARETRAARALRRRAPARWVGVLLLLGWVAQVGYRLWLSRAQNLPLANPDEPGYLIAARVLAGGPGADFSGGTFYQGGYGLLFTPVYWFTGDPATVYRAVMVINAMLNAALFPLGYLAARRIGARRALACGAAMATALLPDAVFYTQFALTDAILPVVVLGWLLCVHGMLTATGRWGPQTAAVGAGLLAGYAYAVHSRGEVVVVVFVVLLTVAAARRWIPCRRAIVAAGALGLALGAALLVDHAVAVADYPGGANDLGGLLWQRVVNPRGEIRILACGVGQLWRMCVDTWGMGAVGLTAAVAAVARRGVRRDLRIMAAGAIAVTVGIIGGSAGALPDERRVDNLVNGRYAASLSIVFFLVAVVVLARAARRRLAWYAAAGVALPVVAAAVVLAYGVPADEPFISFEIAEPAVLSRTWDHLDMPGATLAALVLLAVCVAALLISRHGRVALLVVTAGVSVVANHQMTAHISRTAIAGGRANAVALVTGSGLAPGDPVAIGNAVSWKSVIPQSYQVTWTRPLRFDPAGGPPPGVAVVEVAWPTGVAARVSWPTAPAGWHVAVSDRAHDWVAWRRAPR